MSRLPILSSTQVIKALERFGYVVVRQHGSHIRMTHPTRKEWPVTVPHYKAIDRSLLRLIIQEANLSVPEFLSLLD